jgi:Fe-S cluster assembly protein SufD
VENLYRTWTEFNKKQSQAFKGQSFAQAMDIAESATKLWNHPTYPQGEDWKYVSFEGLQSLNLKSPQEDIPTSQEADASFYTLMVRNFVTPQKLKLSQLPEGLEVVSELESDRPQSHWVQEDRNPFSQMAPSFYGLGLILRFKSSFKSDKPLKLVVDLNSLKDKDLYSHQNIHILLEPGVQAEVYVDIQGQDFSGLSNLNIFCHVAEKSTLEIFSKEKGGGESHLLLNLFSTVEKEGVFKSLDITLPSLWSRHNLSVDLQEKKAHTELHGAYLNNGNYFVDHHTSIRHSVGDTTSFEDYRGILSGKAQAVFNGKVYIAEKAAKSNSDQINKNLMLSEKAEVDTKPELQIYNDDVKATHGATVGQMDPEQLFYLQSRGYRVEQARQILSRAFIFDMITPEDKPMIKSFFFEDVENSLKSLEADR